MMKRRVLSLAVGATVGLAMALTVNPANAVSVSLKIFDGTNTVIQTDNVTTGWASFAGPLGTGPWNINDVSGQAGSNVVPPDVLTSNSLNTSTSTGGNLEVWVTAFNIIDPSGTLLWLSTLTSNTLTVAQISPLVPGEVTLTLQTFLDTANGLYASAAGGTISLLGTASYSAVSVLDTESDATVADTGNNPEGYSITAKYTIQSNAAASSNATINVQAVPGPIVGAGLPGLVLAFGGLLAWSRRRRQQTA